LSRQISPNNMPPATAGCAAKQVTMTQAIGNRIGRTEQGGYIKDQTFGEDSGSRTRRGRQCGAGLQRLKFLEPTLQPTAAITVAQPPTLVLADLGV